MWLSVDSECNLLCSPSIGNELTSENFFKVPVYFEREYDALMFPKEDLQRLIAMAGTDLLEIMQSHLTPLLKGSSLIDDIVARARYLIRCRPSMHVCYLECIAQLLEGAQDTPEYAAQVSIHIQVSISLSTLAT